MKAGFVGIVSVVQRFPHLPAGQPCATGECARGARCVKDMCIAPKPEGEACEADVECQGACDKPQGAAAGKCGKRCTVLTIPTKPAFTPKTPPQAPPQQ